MRFAMRRSARYEPPPAGTNRAGGVRVKLATKPVEKSGLNVSEPRENVLDPNPFTVATLSRTSVRTIQESTRCPKSRPKPSTSSASRPVLD